MLVIARDCFKTSVGTRAMALWIATKDANATIGIFNESEANVKSWIGTIKRIVGESRLYQQLWPEVLPPGVKWDDNRSIPRTWKWGDTGLMFVRQDHNVSELTFEPFGIGGSHTGKHFTHKIYDDIVGEKSATSQAVMDDAIHFVDHGRALERPSDNGCELWNYTRWGYNDVYKHALTKWPKDYKVYFRSLLEHPDTREPDTVNGVSTFPERFPTDKCYQMLESDPLVFASQRQNMPRAGEETAFKPEWVRYGDILTADNGEPMFVIVPEHYDDSIRHSDVMDFEKPPRIIPLQWCHVAILVDPAPTKKSELNQERRARNGLVAMAIDPWGRRLHLQSIPLSKDPVDVLDAVVGLCQRWHTDKVGIEEVNFSKIYAPLWTALLNQKYPYTVISFVPLMTRGMEKDVRIRQIMGPMRQGLYYFNRAESGYTLQELLEYPYSETRDLIDAMAYVESGQILNRPVTPGEIAFDEQQNRSLRDGCDFYTGY